MNQPSDRSGGVFSPVVAASEAIRQVRDGEAWLLDVREAAEWQAGHAPKAHHIPMNDVVFRREELPAVGPILVICHSGARSRMVTEALVAAEYPATNIEGGMEAWRRAGGDVEQQ